MFDPAAGRQTARVAFAGAAEVDAAVAAARRAFESWRSTPLTRRQNIMFAYRELIVRRRLDLARALTAEHGKTLDDSLGEVQRGLEVVEFACNIAHLLKGDFSEQVSASVDTYTVRQPLGVAAGITPFNFPAMVPMWMFPIAIACGNTFVLKPSEKDPSAPQINAELLAEAGLPDGVFNIVHGDKEAVDLLLEHPDVAAVSFVGLHPPSHVIYTSRGPGTASGCRHWAGRRTTWSCCPTPTWSWPPTPRCRPDTDRPASGAWPSPWWWRWAGPPTGCCPWCATGWPA